jgi:hypothetical protein
MRNLVLVAAVTPLLIAAAAPLLSRGPETDAHGDSIHVGDFYFCDIAFQGSICDRTFPVGTEVAWEVVQSSHTITECDDTFSVCPPPGAFDFGVVSNGDSRFRMFNEAGMYEYRCNFHPDQMRGRIVVQAPTTATPTPGATSPPQSSEATPSPGQSPTTVATEAPAQPGSTLERAAAPASALGPAGVPAAGAAEPVQRSLVWRSLLPFLGSASLIACGAFALRVLRRG